MMQQSYATPLQIEYQQRHRKFQATISERAAKISPQVKAPYVPRAYAINPAPFWRDMWFYDLIRCGETYVPGEIPVKYFEVENIQNAVAKYYGVKRADILSSRRTADIIIPRHVAVYLAKELTGKSLPEIGRLFGGRDHTTILFAVQKITKLRDAFPELALAISTITLRIKDETV